jgi:hypothetical protein
MNSQPHALVALPPEKEARVPIQKEAVGGGGGGVVKKKKTLAPVCIRTQHLPARSLVIVLTMLLQLLMGG